MNILRRTCGCALLVSVGFAMLVLDPGASGATATMTIVNRDKANEGLNDTTPVAPVGGNTGTTLGEQRLNALQFAADIWGGALNSPVPIRIGAQFSSLACSSSGALLGQAGAAANVANFDGAPHRDTWYPIALANALSGQDLDPGDNNTDIEATFTSAIDNGSCAFPLRFYYGLDGHNSSNQVDFITTALHELGHGLGFSTLVNLSSGAKAKGFDDAFMRNLVDHSTGKSYPEMTNAERVDASQNTGNLVWAGDAVRAASGVLTSGTVGKDVRMYAPSPQQPGSSVSHWDTVLAPNESMEAIYSTTIHSPGLAKQAFEDMGWPTAGGNQGQLVVTPSSFDFGEVDTGSASDQTFTVSNPGSSTVHVGSTQTTGPDAPEFDVLGGVNSFPLNPGATKNVTVRFTPAAPAGAKTASLRFTST